MVHLQDELAGLNHRLDRKLTTWRQKFRLYKAAALCIGFAIYILFLCVNRWVPWSDATNWTWSNLAFFTAPPVLGYYIYKILAYRWLLKKGRRLKIILYASLAKEIANKAPITGKRYRNMMLFSTRF